MLTLIAFVVALGVLIAVHEYGHYRVAVACGIKVLKFSIGFGKPIYTWRLKGKPTEFAIGMLPQRLERLRFTRPYLRSDIYGVTTKGNRVVRGWDDIDKPGVQVGVQAGTFMEPVMTQSLKQARLVVVAPPTTRERELESGRIDVYMSDYPYTRRLLDNADWAELIRPPKPFHVLPYAYAVKPGDDAWLQTMEKFVERIHADGRLDAAARRNGLGAIVAR